jgi:hypothetical protein
MAITRNATAHRRASLKPANRSFADPASGLSFNKGGTWSAGSCAAAPR